MKARDLKEKAVELRMKGYSYSLIQEEVPVSKSTLSLWLRSVPFTPNQKVQNRVRKATQSIAEYSYRNKKYSLELATQRAKETLGTLSRRDLLMVGVGLYIGEGSKSKGIVRVVNSDPRVIAVAIRWFEEIFNLPTKHFSLSIHLYPDNDLEKSLKFWSNATGIPLNQFGKTQVDTRKKRMGKRGMLKYGTAHLGVRSGGEKEFGVLLFRTILALIEETYRQSV